MMYPLSLVERNICSWSQQISWNVNTELLTNNWTNSDMYYSVLLSNYLMNIWYIWYDTIWHDMIRYDAIYDMIWYDTIRYEMIYDTIRYYTGCPRRNVPDFGRVFLMLKYTDITQNTYVQSWTVTEVMAREKCVLLVGPRTVPVSWQSYPCQSLSVESYNSSSAHARLYRNAR